MKNINNNNNNHRTVQVSFHICPTLGHVTSLYPWQSVILTDYKEYWYVYEDINDAFRDMSNPSLHFVY